MQLPGVHSLRVHGFAAGNRRTGQPGTTAECAAIPVAYGGAERRAAEGALSDGRAQYEVKQSKLLKILYFSGKIWYNWVMRNDKKKTMDSEEMVTISRAEYEEVSRAERTDFCP